MITRKLALALAFTALFGAAANAGPNVHVSVPNFGSIVTTGFKSPGINVKAGLPSLHGNTSVSVLNGKGGKITTKGNDSPGINVNATGGKFGTTKVAVNNKGTIKTSGKNSAGINVNAKGGNANVNVTNSGSITTTGSNSAGISVTAQ